MAGGQSPVESVVSTAFNNFYAGKRVLVTGHTGFKGGWLSLWLSKLGAKVGGISLEAPTNPNFYETISCICYNATHDHDGNVCDSQSDGP